MKKAFVFESPFTWCRPIPKNLNLNAKTRYFSTLPWSGVQLEITLYFLTSSAEFKSTACCFKKLKAPEATSWIFLFSCKVAYLSFYHEKAIKALLRARLGVAGHLSATLNWKNKCQQHDKSTCRFVLQTVPLMLSVKQGGCEWQF